MPEGPTAIDLFCGAGGISRGLENAGFEVLWAADNDADAIRTYRENHSQTKYGAEHGDLSELEPRAVVDDIEPEELDLIAGGPPCPTFSKIGRSKIKSLEGQSPESDERHHLYQDFLRFVDSLSPRAFLMENVTGMLSSTGANGEPIVNIIRDEMEAIGYTVTVQEVDAANFGVPQHRTRLFFIGQRDEAGQIDLRDFDLTDWETHREPRNEQEQQMKHRKEANANPDSSQTTVAEFGVEINKFEHEFQKHPGEKLPYVTVADAILDLPPLSPDGGMPPKEATSYTVPALSEYQEWARDLPDDRSWEDATLTNHSSRGHNLKDLTLYKILGEGVGRNIGDLASHLDPYRDDIFADSYKKQNPRKPSSTIVAHLQKDGHMFIHPREARSLSVREAARLQSFPDSFHFPVSRTVAFRLVGNAVPPRLAEVIGTAIKQEIL